MTGPRSTSEIFQRQTTGPAEVNLLLPDNAVMADAAQGMLATLAATAITVGASGGLAHIHAMAYLRGYAQHLAHHPLPLRAMGSNASPVDVMGNYVGRFMGNHLGEKLLGVLLQ